MIFCVLLLRFGFSRYMKLDRPEAQRKGKSLQGSFTFLSFLSFFVKLLVLEGLKSIFPLKDFQDLMSCLSLKVSSLDQGIKNLILP